MILSTSFHNLLKQHQYTYKALGKNTTYRHEVIVSVSYLNTLSDFDGTEGLATAEGLSAHARAVTVRM